ncbi:beta-1,3-galactosyltransferase 5 [Dasypus novemcinctus]|uniref:beta-1,3-galactosyltransferase 5 n=1 Tax=Dasypus novemcinctus TaxID=9361 RepID=UPI00265E59A6|nr:beta-1,3-galactosyltransferase 5 [Dasypus novemcinctus]XP_058152236.1 beta-1,3-galactosyltransferase 5 [Dasypus novemcinctus]XP_058152237.1 beta-1,3-galactosyltransferase 5 [Dasypus novemcinctus]XP_058152238.1 beta-1,3-galactosyltransferase 5 [Dasypus novemcinctus]
MVHSRLRCIYIFLLPLGALCLYFSMYTLSSLKEEPFIFKKDNGNFLQFPSIDCRHSPPFLVLLVTASPKQVVARSAIRRTWGRENVVKGKRIKTFFLLGASDNEDEMRAVAEESQRHRDIIQKDFVDVYFNLTLKTMMGMEWVHYFCPQASFVMKTDSDMFVNIYYLTELLLKKNKTTRFFTGFLKMNEFPIRKKFNKWFVSKYEYPWDKYPPFCSGTGYVFSSDVASQVYNVSESVPFIKLEDVFVGLCLEKLNIKLEELHSERTFFPEGLRFSPCRFKRIVTCHYIKPPALLTYWQALEGTLEEQCPAV